ncbi:hypothetical protein DAPPUDRAFT_111453 [Daphnia pulex]|uniref:Uncharacterized protein n=1 Tax=Daphnia pulex TaxID=6669 RepID=E9H979_DAPPU|nr:hypothetical protein DAPPUDRAFT_111453 [Daphnia pulex]|eukprot:EFX71750.1 hypothetical protein DAPPUDRAFT_111453 [Daphnia pulex]
MDNGQIVVWTDFEENLNQILIQHSLSILSLSFSPSGRFLSSLDASGKIVIWLPEHIHDKVAPLAPKGPNFPNEPSEPICLMSHLFPFAPFKPDGPLGRLSNISLWTCFPRGSDIRCGNRSTRAMQIHFVEDGSLPQQHPAKDFFPI